MVSTGDNTPISHEQLLAYHNELLAYRVGIQEANADIVASRQSREQNTASMEAALAVCNASNVAAAERERTNQLERLRATEDAAIRAIPTLPYHERTSLLAVINPFAGRRFCCIHNCVTAARTECSSNLSKCAAIVCCVGIIAITFVAYKLSTS